MIAERPSKLHPALARLRALACACVGAAALAGAPALHARAAQDGGATGERALSEDAIKAAYLFKLRNYVEWPRGVPAPLVIGVVGADDLFERLQDLPGVRDARASGSSGSTVSVRRLRVGDPVDGLAIVYIDDVHWRRAADMIEQAASRGVLVASDSPNALATGSMLNFRWTNERMRFEISLDSATQAGIRFNAQLLALALNVVKRK